MSDDSLQRRIEDLQRLLEVTRLWAVELDLDKLLPTLIAEACQAVHCDRATIYLYDEESRELVTRFVTDLEVDEIRISIDEGIAGRVARTRELQHVEDVDREPDHARNVAERVGYTVRNMIAAPLVSAPEEKLVGVIQVLNKLDGQAFDGHDEQLLTAFASHAAVALARARLVIQYKAKQKLEASLAVARDIQRALFPKEMPAAGGYDLAGRSDPCEATGGDYYDVMPLAGGRIGLMLGDVSGHGLGPSLLMATLRAVVRALAPAIDDPGQLVAQLNTQMYADLMPSSFITFFYGILDPGTHTLTYCSAGQGPVWRYDAADDAFLDVPVTDIPLGIQPDHPFLTGEAIAMAPGDCLILASDGIVEAVAPGRERFEADRFQAILRASPDRRCAETLDTVFGAVAEWSDTAPIEDDVTLLLIRRRSG